MADERAPTSEIADILRDYVPRADYEQALDALNEITAERDTHKTGLEKAVPRVAELERKLRTLAAREAYGKAAEKLKVDPKFRDDVFDLAKFPADSDEIDPRKIEQHLGEFLKEKAHYIQAEPPKPKTIPAGDGGDRGRGGAPAKQSYEVSRRNMRDAVWMRDNQADYIAAVKAGVLAIVD